MFKYAALVASAAATVDIPDFVTTDVSLASEEGFDMFKASAQMNSLGTCPWTTADYTKYKDFPKASKMAKDYESCVQVMTWKMAKADLDHNNMINRCEWALACIGEVGYKNGGNTTDDEAKWCIKHSMRLTYDMVQPMCKKYFG